MLPILGILSPIIGKILDFIPDAKTKAEAQLKIQEELDRNSEAILNALTQVDKSQAETNTEEAKSTNLFISGWRPSIGWCCGAVFAWSYLLQPMLSFILSALGHPIKDLPILNLSEMTPVLLGMLGLGGMRTWEKIQGVNNNH